MRLTAHWELKIVALVLAVALFVYTSGQVRVERTITILVTDSSVKGLPPDYQVVNIRPQDFKVRLSVPTSRLADLEAETVIPRLELRPEQLQAEEASWPLTSALLRLPNDIRIEATEPPDLRELSLKLDRVTEGTLPAEPPHVAGLPAGLDYTLRLEPTLVRIEAGGDVLDSLQLQHERIRFQEVDLRSVDPRLTGERQEQVLLTPRPASREAPYRVLDQARAVIQIRPLLGVTQELSAPVKLLASGDLLRSVDVTITPPRVALTVRGPENLLNSLKAEALTAFIRLPDDIGPESARELPIEILAPPWLVVDPAAVRITVVPPAKP